MSRKLTILFSTEEESALALMSQAEGLKPQALIKVALRAYGAFPAAVKRSRGKPFEKGSDPRQFVRPAKEGGSKLEIIKQLCD